MHTRTIARKPINGADPKVKYNLLTKSLSFSISANQLQQVSFAVRWLGTVDGGATRSPGGAAAARTRHTLAPGSHEPAAAVIF